MTERDVTRADIDEAEKDRRRKVMAAAAARTASHIAELRLADALAEAEVLPEMAIRDTIEAWCEGRISDEQAILTTGAQSRNDLRELAARCGAAPPAAGTEAIEPHGPPQEGGVLPDTPPESRPGMADGKREAGDPASGYAAVKPDTAVAQRLTGPAEAERQARVAIRLYQAAHGQVEWAKVSLDRRRPYIDRASKPPHVDEMA